MIHRYLLVAMLLTLVLYAGGVMADGPEDIGEPLDYVWFYLSGADGKDMGTAYLNWPQSLPDSWHSYTCSSDDPNVLNSLGEPLEAGGQLLVNADYCIAVAPPQSRCRMPWPIYPSGQLLSANFSDGTVAVIRLPEDYGALGGTAELHGETVSLVPISAQAFALWQMFGPEPPDELLNRESWPAWAWVAEADCRSLAASATGDGKKEALLFAAEAVVRMLEEFHARHGRYPITLSHLTRGNLAVASVAPGNPYFWPESLLDDLRPKSAEEPGLIYLPLGVSDGGPVTNTGYALGAIGPGEPDSVPQQVSTRLKNPPAAIKWFTGGESPEPFFPVK